MFGPCMCFISIYIRNLFVAHASVVAWRLVCTSCRPSLAFYGMSHFLGLGLCLAMGFSSYSPFSFSFLQSLRVLPYCSAIPAVVLFDPLLGLVGYVGHPWPIYFSWALLALFLALHSYGLLLTPLGFLVPITLSFILGAHGLSINPLLFLLSLLWACCGPFSLFYITYYPWVCLFSLSELL